MQQLERPDHTLHCSAGQAFLRSPVCRRGLPACITCMHAYLKPSFTASSFTSSVLQAAADDWRLKLAYPLLMLLARRRVAQYFFDKFRDPKNLKAVLARVYGDPALVDDALVDMIYTPSSGPPLWPEAMLAASPIATHLGR